MTIKQVHNYPHDASNVALRVWQNAAPDLAERLMELCVFNRPDSRGGYWRDDTGEYHVTTRKSTDRNWTPNDVATLSRHFMAPDHQDLVGVHAINPISGTSRWGAIDIDDHEGQDIGGNLRKALMIREAAADLKFRLHLFQSDGRGGIHGWIYFDSPVPSERVYGMLKKIVGNDFVETFPKQPSIGPSEFGNWLRLPGRHYKRAAWARMFGECGWLSPDATIDAILQIEPDDARRVPQYKVEIPIISRPVYQGHRSHFAESPETLRSWLESKGVEVKALKPCSNGAVRLILGLCPFNPDHGDGRSDTSVMVVWSALGLRFCCLHNRCRAYRWVHLREKLDDAYRSRRRC